MRLPAINQKLIRFMMDNEVDNKADTESEYISVGTLAAKNSYNIYLGLSGDSLAFTLVHVSVFTLTLLYVGIRLARWWQKKNCPAALLGYYQVRSLLSVSVTSDTNMFMNFCLMKELNPLSNLVSICR